MSRRPSRANPRTLIAVLASILGLIAGAGEAQVVPPVFPAIDGNGIDVATGDFVMSQTDVVIGQPGSGGLAYTRYLYSGAATHNHHGYITGNGSGGLTVTIGQHSETFTVSGGAYVSTQQNGSQLTYNSATQQSTYTMRDGTTALFISTMLPTGNGYWIMQGMPYNTSAQLMRITMPSGDIIDYGYEGASVVICIPDPELCWGQEFYYYARLATVSTNAGYILFIQYPGPADTQVAPNKVTGVNRAVEYCTGANCSPSWPYATYAYTPTTMSVTNAAGVATTYTYTGGRITKVQFPDDPAHSINIAYNAAIRVQSINRGFGTWTYGYADASGQRTTTVTNPDSTIRSYISTIATGRINSVTNELNKTVSYQYDSAARETRVTQPEGNYVQYTLDARGNITQARQVSKTPGTPADIVASAVYPASCTNQKTCNKPTSTTDARGFRTDYTYDATHGGVLTVTAPAPSGAAPIGSGTRPQTRITYAQFQAYYKTYITTWGNGTPVWRPTVTSTCATQASCAGTADETRTTSVYPGASTPNNVLPTSTTTAAGNGAISATTVMTFNGWGDINTVDGPLAGAADTTRYYYDAVRRPIGVVGPDPDGGGALQYRAARTAYNAVGLPTVVERGTVTSQGDSALSSFSSLEKQDTVYDSYARPVQSRVWNGGSIVALAQFNYDNRGRAQCTAVRMNSAYFGSPPADACIQGSAGVFGPDRISRKFYDSAGHVTQVQSGYGTALAQTTEAYTYSNNGQVLTLTDARSYRTSYEYDGFDRLSKRLYPSPTTPNQSSGSDYEQFTYNAAGSVTQERRRSGDNFANTFDNLNRVTLRNAPGTQPDVTLAYDLLSRTTSESQSGNALTTVYDALSRATSVTSSVLGAVSYQYDAAGRRTQMTYPGSFYVTYAYNTSDLTGILENGAVSLATYAYDDLGRRTSLTRGSGAVTNYTFDSISRLATLVQNPTGTTHDTTLTFAYNPGSQITSRTRTNSAYDWVLPASSTQNYTADGLNRYTSALGVTPTYDTRGNLTGDGTKTYGYDYDNRIISASGGVTVGYDPAGRLHQVAGGSTTRFLYDGTDVIAEYNTSGTVLRRYVHGPGTDEPLAWYEGSGTTDRRYLLADERGSVIGVSNSSGTVTQVDKYDAYGVPDAANQGRFQYTGQMWISELGLYHYKARAYHPRLGRFLQTDPISTSGGMNLYAYGGGDPVNRTDSFGFCSNLITWRDNFRPPTYTEKPGEDVFTYGGVLSFCMDDWLATDWSMYPGYAGGGGSAGGSTPSQGELPKCTNVPEVAFTSHVGMFGKAGATFSPLRLRVRGEVEANLFTYNTPLTGDPYWDHGFEVSLQIHKITIGFQWNQRSYNGGLSFESQPTNFALWDLNASTDGTDYEVGLGVGSGFTAGIDNVFGLLPSGDTPQCR